MEKNSISFEYAVATEFEMVKDLLERYIAKYAANPDAQ